MAKINNLQSFWSEAKHEFEFHDVGFTESSRQCEPFPVGLTHSADWIPTEPMELIESLPRRPACDQLVTLFFEIYDPSMPVACT